MLANTQALHNILYEVLCIAINAGKIVMKFHGDTFYKQKDDKSPITQADLESNTYITTSLHSISPYKVCSEEATIAYHERKDLKYFWLIDPLDGTKDFLARNGNFTINIALIHNDKPILGVVYAPYLYEAYIGLCGFGSFGYNIKDFKVFANTENTLENKINWLKANKIKLGKKYARQIYGNKLEYLHDIDLNIKEHILANIDTWENNNKEYSIKRLVGCDSIFHSTKETKDFLIKHNAVILKRGSSLKICALASGIAEIYPRMNGTSEWDTAASDIILQESSGAIIDLQTKQPLIYNKKNMRNNHFVAFTSMYKESIIYKNMLNGCL